MKTIAKLLLTVIIVITSAFSSVIKAQEAVPQENLNNLNNQVGMRLGGYSGITYRHWGNKNKPNVGFEISLMGWAPYHGALLSAMIEKNMPLRNNFYLYFGGGAFIGNYEYRPYVYRIEDRWYVFENGGPYFGIQGVFGCDYYFPNTQLVAGLDITPRFFNIVYPYFWDAGLNIRYRF